MMNQKQEMELKDLMSYLVKENGFYVYYDLSELEYFFENSDDYYEFAQRPELDHAQVLYIGAKGDHPYVIVNKF